MWYLQPSSLFIKFRQTDGIGNFLIPSNCSLLVRCTNQICLWTLVKVRSIHIDFNFSKFALYKNWALHTIYEYAIHDNPGFVFDESSKNLIYLRDINNISLKILNQSFEPVNFRREEIIGRSQFQKLTYKDGSSHYWWWLNVHSQYELYIINMNSLLTTSQFHNNSQRQNKVQQGEEIHTIIILQSIFPRSLGYYIVSSVVRHFSTTCIKVENRT